MHSSKVELTLFSDVTQDVASKGLGVVYEKCNDEQKKVLVSSLVDTLSTGTQTHTLHIELTHVLMTSQHVGKKQVQKVESGTQVFESGALRKTPDGKNLAT